MTKQAELKNQLQKKAEGTTGQVQVNPAQQIQTYLAKMGPEIAKACGSLVKAEELGRVALTTIRMNPKLMECNIQSLMAGVMMAAQLGLRIDPTLGQAYLVPFNNRKNNTKEAQFILGYRGMLALIRNSGEVSNIMAHAVYDNDLFVLKYGLDEKLEHIPWHCREDRKFTEGGEFKGAYVVAKLKDGGNAHLYMPKAEIDAHKLRSKAWDNYLKYKTECPWNTDYEAMALKTVVRGIAKWLPMSIDDYRKMAANDETVKTEIAADMSDVVDITADQQPVNVGDITEKAGEEAAEVSDGQMQAEQDDTTDLQQTVFRLLAELAKLRGESPDDMIDTLTNHKVGCQQDLMDKSAAYLEDIRRTIEAEIAKEA